MVLYSASLLGFWAPLIYLPRGGRAKSRTDSTQAAFPIGAPDVTTSQTRRGKGVWTPGSGMNTVIPGLLSEYPGTIGVPPGWRESQELGPMVHVSLWGI